MLQKGRVIARSYRNRKIGDFLKELKLTEGRGTGIPIIIDEIDKNGSPPPIFETDSDKTYFLCIIKIHPLANSKTEHRDKERAKDGDIDIKQYISSLEGIDKYLRLFNTQRWDKDKLDILKAVDIITIKILTFCIEPKSREEVFKHIGLYNNSKNFSKHIKPIIDLNWLQLTIPDKPTSKNQKYITSSIAQILLKGEISRQPVSSSNIASIGYHRENQVLEIEFHHGGIYQYYDVSIEEYKALINANSISSYFHHNIRSNYEYAKM